METQVQAEKAVKEKRKKVKVWNQRGLTLIEMIVVIALAGVMLATVSMMVTKGRSTAKHGDVTQKLQLVVDGLAERKMYAGKLPTHAKAAISSITELQSYVPTQISGSYKYECGPTTNDPVVTTEAFDSLDEARAAASKMMDMGICTSSSTVDATDKAVNCIVKQFAGQNACQ